MARTVLVTGANSGLGLETALHVAGLGFRVVGTARSEEKAEVLEKAASEAGASVETAVVDVTDRQGCQELVASVEPWGLVNNAGYMNAGAVIDISEEEALRQLHVMVVAPMRLAAQALPFMRRRGEGRIVNVSSVQAHATGAMTGWYGASKHALSAVTDALRREVAAYGVDVVLIEPGGLKTGIWDKARDDLLRRREGSARPTAYDRSLQILEKTRRRMGDPRRAAEVIGRALTASRPRAHYRVGRDAPVVELLNIVVPNRVKDRLLRRAIGG
ncbi:MAG: SDR family NAD(P)-dependent oxidoreductase [Actinomycetota bacterium]|nr:SDR family NAD(P)-dependent oxidoreductase [Actinomycetota bacterium]